MEQWNNVELSDLSRKSYTLNHEYDINNHKINNNNNNDNTNNSNGNNNNNNSSQNEKNGILQPGSDIKPKIQLEDVEILVRRLYGITLGECKEIISYDDKNYHIKEDPNIKNPLIVSHWPHGYIFKVMNSLDSKKTDFVDAQNQVLLYLGKQNIQCPRPIANLNGNYYSIEEIGGEKHVVRLLEFIPGKIFHQVPITNHLLYQSGEYLAKVDKALKNFSHDAYKTHKTLWQLQSVAQLREFVYALKDPVREDLVEQIITAFEKHVLSQLTKLESQIIHGDYNEQNILVESVGDPGDEVYRVSGIIDFGDTSYSPILFEVGIALTYMILQAKSLAAGGIFIAGYNSIRLLRKSETNLLKYCVAARLAQSLTMGAYTHAQDPQNDYVLVTQEQGWKIIDELWNENFNNVDELWQNESDKYLTQSTK